MQAGKYIIFLGLIIVFIGIIYYFFGDKLGWIGRLPGDIRFETENTKVFFPITTMILFSILFSVVMWLIRKLG